MTDNITMTDEYVYANGKLAEVLRVDRPGEEYKKAPVVSMGADGHIRSHNQDGRVVFGDNKYDLVKRSPYYSYKKGERAMVRDTNIQSWKRRYFSHLGEDGRPRCFHDGQDEWSNTRGDNLCFWRQMRRPDEEEM